MPAPHSTDPAGACRTGAEHGAAAAASQPPPRPTVPPAPTAPQQRVPHFSRLWREGLPRACRRLGLLAREAASHSAALNCPRHLFSSHSTHSARPGDTGNPQASQVRKFRNTGGTWLWSASAGFSASGTGLDATDQNSGFFGNAACTGSAGATSRSGAIGGAMGKATTGASAEAARTVEGSVAASTFPSRTEPCTAGVSSSRISSSSVPSPRMRSSDSSAATSTAGTSATVTCGTFSAARASLHRGLHHLAQPLQRRQITLPKSIHLPGEKFEDAQHLVVIHHRHHHNGCDAQLPATFAIHPRIALRIVTPQTACESARSRPKSQTRWKAARPVPARSRPSWRGTAYHSSRVRRSAIAAPFAPVMYCARSASNCSAASRSFRAMSAIDDPPSSPGNRTAEASVECTPASPARAAERPACEVRVVFPCSTISAPDSASEALRRPPNASRHRPVQSRISVMARMPTESGHRAQSGRRNSFNTIKRMQYLESRSEPARCQDSPHPEVP